MKNIDATFDSTNWDNIGILGKGLLPLHKNEERAIRENINYFNLLPGSEQNFKVVETQTYGEPTAEHPQGSIRKTEIHGNISNEGGRFDYWVIITAAA